MAQIHARVSDSTKKKVQKILEDLGLDMSTAVNMYFEKIVLTEGIPFQISKSPALCSHPICTGKKRVPDHIMNEWKQEAEEAQEKGQVYDSVDEMFDDILLEEDDQC
jgi:DNA-damage-inducible protein J